MVVGDQQQGGFGTVDAIMALMVLAITISMTLAAGTVAAKLSRAAIEAREADQILAYLINDENTQAVSSSGNSGKFAWTLTVEPLAQSDLRVCRRSAEVRATHSQKSYRLVLDEACPRQSGPTG